MKIRLLIIGFVLFSLPVAAEGIDKARALEIALQSPAVQAFSGLIQAMHNNCVSKDVVSTCDSDWVTCIEDAWVVKFRVSGECRAPVNDQLGVTLLIDNKTGAIISHYPETAYFNDPAYCLNDTDCFLIEAPHPQAHCANFIDALIKDPSAHADGQCACHNFKCRVREG